MYTRRNRRCDHFYSQYCDRCRNRSLQPVAETLIQRFLYPIAAIAIMIVPFTHRFDTVHCINYYCCKG